MKKTLIENMTIDKSKEQQTPSQWLCILLLNNNENDNDNNNQACMVVRMSFYKTHVLELDAVPCFTLMQMQRHSLR